MLAAAAGWKFCFCEIEFVFSEVYTNIQEADYGGMANDPKNWEDIAYDPMTMQIKPAAQNIAVSAGLPVFEHSTLVAEYLECSKTSNARAPCTSTKGCLRSKSSGPRRLRFD